MEIRGKIKVIDLDCRLTRGKLVWRENFDFSSLASAATPSPTVRVLPKPERPLTLPCTVYPPKVTPGRKQGLVIHLYGSGGSHTSYNLRREAYDQLRCGLHEAGYWVVIPELGPTHWMNARATATLEAVVDGLLSQEEIDPDRVHLLGTSMGGGSSLIYARTHQHMVRSLCLLFPITDFEAWVSERPAYRRPIMQAHGITASSEIGADLRALSPLHYAADFVNMPIYLMHGDADDTVPVHHSRDFAQSLNYAGGNVTYREIPGGTHCDDIAVGWHNEILKFFTNAESHKRYEKQPK